MMDNTFAGAELEKKYKDDIERYELGEIGKIFPCHLQRNRQTNEKDLKHQLRLQADRNEFNDLFDLITKQGQLSQKYITARYEKKLPYVSKKMLAYPKKNNKITREEFEELMLKDFQAMENSRYDYR